ncbi:MAG: AMP-binding protein [Actinomycetota bacterium]|nr:AMP-binding protein [Actinomycetota bacterium]MDA8293433.1 AMP-binding protein [Actinomycetota bacterium]
MTRAQSAVELLVRERARAHPDATWLAFGDETYTWGEVLSFARRAANGWLELGVRPADRVAILLGNCPEFIWSYLGLLFMGAGPVPVNTAQRGVTLHHILADSGVRAAIVSEALRPVFDEARVGCPDLAHTVVVGGRPGGGIDWDVERLLGAADTEPVVDLAEAPPAAAMLYTSGTTGPPKGVVTSSYDASPIGMLLGAAGVGPGETMYTPLPLFHGNALYVSMIGSMVLDARFALAERFSASRFFDDCRRFDAVEFNALGGMISILLKQPVRPDDADNPVRTVLSAGCPPDRWEEFERRFGLRLVEWFGMVDAPGILLNTEGRVGSMGKPIAGVEFAVVDDAGQPVPVDTTGELVFRHPAGQLTHYHGLPDATEAAYRGGWFHTGDLASQDAEGFYYYKGRKKESIRRLGENISAWEIETVVNAHPAVQESAAHAVPSELGEDEVKLVVVPKPGAHVSPEALTEFCDGKVAGYAVPRYVEIVDELPKTGTQRVRYGVLKERGITPATWDRLGTDDAAGSPAGSPAGATTKEQHA